MTSPASADLSPPRVVPRAGAAFAGIWRLTARRFFTPGYWLVLLGMLALLVVLSLPAASNEARAVRHFLPWSAGFYASFLVPILSFIAAAGAMRDDLQPATVDYVLTRPVPRSQFVLFRSVAQMLVTQIDFLFAFAVIVGIGLFWSVPDLAAALPRLALTQVAAVTVYSAAGILCGLVTSRYVIVGVLYGALVEVGLGNVPTQLNQISLLRHLHDLSYPLLTTDSWSLAMRAPVAPDGIAGALVALALVSTGAIALAACLFSFRQFSGSATRDP